MAPSGDRDVQLNTRALQEARRSMDNLAKAIDVFNANLVAVGKLMKDRLEAAQLEKNKCKDHQCSVHEDHQHGEKCGPGCIHCHWTGVRPL